jgi:hypothetical protein
MASRRSRRPGEVGAKIEITPSDERDLLHRLMPEGLAKP